MISKRTTNAVVIASAIAVASSSTHASCGIDSYQYAERVAQRYKMDRPESLLSNCGIGGLIDLDFLGGIDLLGALKDFIERGVCGAVEEAVSSVRDPLNESIRDANSTTREAENALQQLEKETFDDKYLPFGGKAGDAISDDQWNDLYDRVLK